MPLPFSFLSRLDRKKGKGDVTILSGFSIELDKNDIWCTKRQNTYLSNTGTDTSQTRKDKQCPTGECENGRCSPLLQRHLLGSSQQLTSDWFVLFFICGLYTLVFLCDHRVCLTDRCRLRLGTWLCIVWTASIADCTYLYLTSSQTRHIYEWSRDQVSDSYKHQDQDKMQRRK